jgi:nitrogen-specific signal transduction histidine kinase
MEAIRMRGSTGTAERLVCAIAHEIGNHLGGIRLQAHLLDEDLDARSLAEASVAIDELAGRSGPLLALIRPLLSEEPRASGGETWSSLVDRVRQRVEDEGTRGVRVEFRGVEGEVLGAEGADWVQSLLTALIGVTISHVAPRGSIVLDLDRRGNERAVVLVDEGEEEDLSADANECGRPLLLAIARELIEREGGRVETTRESGRTRVALVFQQAR